ncbi:MAG: hypothetical protein U5N58_06135 [Actinomycetota bacterium]|nr:hypothetical protein [Actinomycetota bacterium]
MAYDTVSFECLITSVLPGSGALYYHQPGTIKDRQDFKAYPWDQIPDLFREKYYEDFKLLSQEMPPRMKAVEGLRKRYF